MDAILTMAEKVQALLAATGLSPAAQSCLFGVVTATLVIVLMNQLRYLVRGGILLMASLVAVELVKPAFIAVGARLLMVH